MSNLTPETIDHLRKLGNLVEPIHEDSSRFIIAINGKLAEIQKCTDAFNHTFLTLDSFIQFLNENPDYIPAEKRAPVMIGAKSILATLNPGSPVKKTACLPFTCSDEVDYLKTIIGSRLSQEAFRVLLLGQFYGCFPSDLLPLISSVKLSKTQDYQINYLSRSTHNDNKTTISIMAADQSVALSLNTEWEFTAPIFDQIDKEYTFKVALNVHLDDGIEFSLYPLNIKDAFDTARRDIQDRLIDQLDTASQYAVYEAETNFTHTYADVLGPK